VGIGWARRGYVVAVAAIVAAVSIGCVEKQIPPGAKEYVVFDGLIQPTALAFSPDGRVFVAEKRGVVKVFDDVNDDSPDVVADLRTQVHNFWDRGMLDIALPPDFPADPSLYVLYTYDAVPGGTAPRWGTPDTDEDNCPTPPGPTTDGCVVQGRLSRLPLDGGTTWNGQEQVVLTGWCQQFPSHSIGALAFAPDGTLYVSGGEGASFDFADYGQTGVPRNPCGDPPGGVGGAMAPPQAEGGSLRSQDLRTPGDPTGLDGAILRIDPATGAAMPDNPLAGSPDANARRIVAYGFRNPFRFTLRPGTDELWIGDVGSHVYEEIDRSIGDDGVVDNFGWPCFEGPGRHALFDQVDLAICEQLYATGPPGSPGSAVKQPFFTYRHDQDLTEGERCARTRGSAIAGLAFAPGDSVYPAEYGELFFADAVRGCIWSMRAGADGLPDASTVQRFLAPAASPVDLQFGPAGELWFADLEGGSIHRIGYTGNNHPPVAAVSADTTAGDPPLTVQLDATGSSDVDPGDELSYAWDVDNDGAFDDGDQPTLTTTYTTEGWKVPRVRVTDLAGDHDVAFTAVVVGSSDVPTAVITQPADRTTAAVGDVVEFAGMAVSGTGEMLPASTMRWTVNLLHCPDDCHRHFGVYTDSRVASGTFRMPDHELPAMVELQLSVTSGDITSTTSRIVDFTSTELTLQSQPAGVVLSAGTHVAAAPYSRRFATNGAVTLTAPATATIGGVTHTFTGWSDEGARSHGITVPAEPTTYVATYAPAG
jgi:glucose/arabinose dehydrogenase